ncbi:MAG: arylsulfatase [Blastopirellula sp.]|nr:arylsulfatase [Blastopirellula sp.]
MFLFLAITQAGCRRSFPRHLLHKITTLAISAVVVLVAQVIHTQPVNADQASRPNLVLIMADDMGYGDASCLNPAAKFRTPHIDRLAREGVSFTDGHCSDTVCTPSRYGLLTGRYSWRTTLKRGVFGAEKPCLIADTRWTLASLLRTRGYQTGMVGKWHLGMDFPGEVGHRDWTQPTRDMPLDKGFDYYYGIPASMNYGVLAWFEGRHAKVPPTLYTAKKPNALAIADYRIKPPYQDTAEDTEIVLGKPGMEVAPDFVDSECLTRFTDQAIAWLKRASSDPEGRPFFLYLPYTSPHKPVIPIKPFRGQGEAGAYGEFMIETDHHVGRVLDFLDQAKLTENTLVVFTSDNGPETTWKERKARFQHASNGPYRDGKRSVYEGGHRVPFIVRWPAGIRQPGRVWEGTVCQTDLLATLAEITGVPLPENAGEDSQSFAVALQNPDAPSPTRKPLMHHAANGRFAIRSGEWKLILPFGKQSAELYHLASDPAERRNVLAQQPNIARQLEQQATEIVCSGRTTAGKPQTNDTEHWAALSWITPQQYAERHGK